MFKSKKQEGFSLVMVLVLIVFIAMISGFFARNIVSDLRRIRMEEERIQAYYLARSGIQSVSMWLETADEEEIEQILGVQSEPVEFSEGSFEVQLTREYIQKGEEVDEGNEEQEGEEEIIYILEATGRVKDTTELVTVHLRPLEYSAFDMAVYAHEYLRMTGSSLIDYDAGTGSREVGSVSLGPAVSIDGDFYIVEGAEEEVVFAVEGDYYTHRDRIGGEVKHSPPIVYELPEFPEFPGDKGELNYGGSQFIAQGNETRYIYDDDWYDEIRVRAGSTVEIHIFDEDLKIQTSSLEVSGSAGIEVHRHGDGELLLYVEDEFDIAGSGYINKDGEPEDVIMYYRGQEGLDPAGSTVYKGSLYSREADITLAGSGGIQGHILSGGNEVNIVGAATAHVRGLVAPNADVNIKGSGEIKGSLIANTVNMVGTGTVKYDDSIEDLFPFDVEIAGKSFDQIWY